ncbi:MAG: chromate transporter [Lachnospiraceae bacterium]|nr:chromate transporter [Lachnospiraceae bacterium]
MDSKKKDLFITFAKIGLFTFGGGYAMIPLIQKEVVDNKKWVSDKDILDVVAIAESTPGPIAVNAATFIGKKVAGPAGALMATIGVVLPSFVIIVAISFVLETFQHLRIVQYAFRGIRAGVLALILKALFTLLKQCKKDVFSIALMSLTFAASVFLDINAIILIICCGVMGIIVTSYRRGREKNDIS